MDIPGIHHVQIAIPKDGEDSARIFNGDLLGLEQIPKPGHLHRRGGEWFRTANLELHLGVDRKFRSATKAHGALQSAEIADLRRQLVLHGHQVVDDETLPGFDRFSSADPFGNRVELLESSEIST